MVSAKSFPDRSRPLFLQPTQMGFCSIRPLCVCGQQQTMNRMVNESIHKVWSNPDIKPVMIQSTGWSLPRLLWLVA